MKKVTYIVSDINKALAFEWVATHLDRTQFDLSFVLLNRGGSVLEGFLKEKGVSVRRIRLRSGAALVITFFQLWAWLLVKRPDVIHTHLRYASLLGITAGYLAGIRRRIHTRHHSSFHVIYHPHAVKTDRWISRLSTRIVSISDVVTEVLVEWEGTPRDKVVKIPHGFDLELFEKVESARVEVLRRKYIREGKGPIVGMISRYIEWKGVTYGIEAFQDILQKYPNALLLLANARGPDAQLVKTYTDALPDGTFVEIDFESDIAALYPLMDVFVHAPIDRHFEAFGQTYVEALAAGIPMVGTLSGIGCEILEHKKNAWVVPFKNTQAIADGVCAILNDEQLRFALIQEGKQSITDFDLKTFISMLESLYARG